MSSLGQLDVDFWAAFDYDPATGRWSLVEGVAPLDVYELSLARQRGYQRYLDRLPPVDAIVAAKDSAGRRSRS